MTKLTALIACVAVAIAAPAFAQTNTTAPTGKTAAASAMAAKPAKAKGPAKTEAKTPEGKACSAQADAQNLHGAARKAFRSKCKAAAAKGAAPTA